MLQAISHGTLVSPDSRVTRYSTSWCGLVHAGSDSADVFVICEGFCASLSCRLCLFVFFCCFFNHLLQSFKFSGDLGFIVGFAYPVDHLAHVG